MDKKSQKIFDEIRQMESDALDDVKKTAEKINAERRQKLLVKDKDLIKKYTSYIEEYHKTVLELRTGGCLSAPDAETLALARVIEEAITDYIDETSDGYYPY